MPEFVYVCKNCDEIVYDTREGCKCGKQRWEKKATYFRISEQPLSTRIEVEMAFLGIGDSFVARFVKEMERIKGGE